MLDNYPVINTSANQKKYIKLYNNAVKNGKYKLEDVPCILCGSNNKKILFKNDRYGINQITVICRECGLIYSSPRMTVESLKIFYESDEYQKIYGKSPLTDTFEMKYKNAADYSYKSFEPDNYRNLTFIDFLRESRISYDTVCEIGAAGGSNLIPFKKMGKEVTGIEYNKNLVKLSLLKGINMIQGSIDDIDKSYDMIILIHVLEHFHDPINQIKKLKKYIKKYLFIEIPGIVTFVPSLQNAHLYYFSKNTLLYCISEAGLKIVTYKIVQSNDYILALFEKNSPAPYRYDFKCEVKKNLSIVNKFKLRNFLKNIIKVLPFGEKVLNKMKVFFKVKRIK